MAQQQQQRRRGQQRGQQPTYGQQQGIGTGRRATYGGGVGTGTTIGRQTAQYGPQAAGSVGTATTMGRQTAQYGPQIGGRTGGAVETVGLPMQFEDTMTTEMRQALEDFSKVDKACEWAVDRSVGQGIPEAVRILQDVADLAEVNEKLLARSSKVGPHAAEAFIFAASDALDELGQYSEPHIVETANVISRAIDSTQKLLDSIGWTGDFGVGGHSGQPQTYY